jgi:hypothetical protein
LLGENGFLGEECEGCWEKSVRFWEKTVKVVMGEVFSREGGLAGLLGDRSE